MACSKREVSRHLLFLALIGLMLFFLAIAGQDHSRMTRRMPLPVTVTRSPASVARTLDIEPILPGSE